MKKIKSFALFAVAAVFLPLGASCSQSQPEITFGFIKLVLYQEGAGAVERFSFFIIPDDEDGIENLDRLFLYHDREQLRWVLNHNDWISYTDFNGVTWIGTRSIALQDNMSLPRGAYRAVLVNLGGESSERTFHFDGGARFPFPALEISDGQFTVRSEWPVNRFVAHTIEGFYVTTIEVPAHTGLTSDLNLPSMVFSVALWAEDTERFTSAFTNVVPLN
ncbi:MAG: hypothetical protein FWG66_04270 [Spirochaetes bacterium]|nr:hypothetical protein [Spirochaetota bacterium]